MCWRVRVSSGVSSWRWVLLTILATLVLSAGCGGDSGEDRFMSCRYRGGPGNWNYGCEVVEQCDESEPCDGSDTANCDPGRTNCFRCGTIPFVSC